MRKKLLFNLIIVVMGVVLCSCNNKQSDNEKNGINNSVEEMEEEYENIAYQNFKTYTSITNIEMDEVKEEVGEMKYIYQVNNKDDLNIDKYRHYLTDEYGFTYNSETSDVENEYYDYKGSSIKLEIIKEEKDTFLVIHIPLNDNYLEQNIGKKYDEALECINNENFRTARETLISIKNIENYFEYKDVQKALSYANAMLYKKSNIYGSAIMSFGNASGYKDADDQRNELLKLVAEYEGTWYYDNPKQAGKGLGYYMFIKNGMVAFVYESSLNNGGEIYYSNSLAMKHNDENSLDEIFVVSSLVGLFEDIKDEDYDYLFVRLPDGGLTVSGRHSDGMDYFTGIYDRISDEIPKSDEQKGENNSSNLLDNNRIADLLVEYPSYVNELSDYVTSIHRLVFYNGESFVDFDDYSDYFSDFFIWAAEITDYNGKVEVEYQEVWKEFQELIEYHVNVLNESYNKNNEEALQLIGQLMNYITEKSTAISQLIKNIK